MKLKHEDTGLSKLLDVIPDKSVTIDAEVKVNLKDLELLGAKAHISLASFEMAQKLEFIYPKNTNLTQSWRDLVAKQSRPACGIKSNRMELEEGCPWCGFSYRQIKR